MDQTVKISNGISITTDDRRFGQKFNGEDFEVEMPLPSQKAYIISQIARVGGGFSREVLGEAQYGYITMCVTLQNQIVKHPDWWKGTDNCADENLLEEIWRFYLESEKNFDSRLKRKLKEKPVGES
jgi:hypothetical protein